jgi:serine/threonine-protein kinase
MSESGHTERLEAALDGKYRIERKLGEGGMATVYLAEDIKHERKVALKILRPELAAVIGAERFLSEIKTTANLQHPHILALFDSGEAGGYLYYVMPYIDGETLREKLDREKQLGVEEAVRIARDVADALDYAHRAGVIHRDIKPGNILLHDGRPVVADFGIALAVSAAGGGRMTETGLSLGTPHYMSPEQASADRDLSARSDVYSLGCVLYEMLAGQPPHTGPSAQSILVHILTKDVTPLTELRHTVPPNVAATVARAIEKLPADRFETAKAFMEALGDAGFAYEPRPFAKTAAVAAPSSPAPARRPAWQSVLPWGVAGVLAMAMTAFWLRPAPPALVQRFPLALGDLGYGSGPAMAVSPDGSTIAYVGQDERLYWRSVSSLEAQVVAGSELARTPFFSPDGRTIAYTVGPPTDDRIRTMSLDGAPPRWLSPDHFPGGTWGEDGFVYYVDLPGALWRASDQGGEPELLAEASVDRLFRWPDALPGGRSLLVSTSAETVSTFDIESREATPLLAGSMARYAGGHVFWVNAEGTLFAAPFDPRTLELTAAGVELAEGLQASLQGSFDFAVSESGTLLYARGAGGSRGGENLVWWDRDERPAVIDPRIGEELVDVDNLALSPDGRFIALEVATSPGTIDGASQIWIYDLAQGVPTRLTFQGDRNAQPRWMPDGRTVAYLSDQGEGPIAIWSQPYDRSGTDRLLFQGEWDIAGFDVARVEGLPIIVGGEGGLWLAEPGSGSTRPFLVTSFREYRPRISPDGRWIAYVSDESGGFEVYVRSFPGGGRPWPISRGAGQVPMWSRSGEEIFYATPDSGLMAAAVELGAEVRVSGTRVVLSDVLALELSGYVERPSASYDVSPDGERLLLIAGSGTGVTLESAEGSVVVLNVFEELRERLGEN